MGRSQQSPHSKCLCRKIFSSPCPICKLAATHASPEQEKNKPARAEMTPSITKVLVAEPTHVKANPNAEEKQKRKLEAQLTKSNRTASLIYNDAFSDYINRAKLRIRAMSTVGMEKTVSGTYEVDDAEKEEKSKDTFANFISRAKLKSKEGFGW